MTLSRDQKHRFYSKWKQAGKHDNAVNEDTDRKIETAKSNYNKKIETKLSNSKKIWSVVNCLASNKK